MSRTIKSKEAQFVHNFNRWSKAYGYDHDYGWVETEDRIYFGLIPFKHKREKFKANVYVKHKTALHQRKNCVVGENKRILNKKHRVKVRILVQRFAHGFEEDVITTAIGPRNPMEYWA